MHVCGVNDDFPRRMSLGLLLKRALHRLYRRPARGALIVQVGAAALDRGALRFSAPSRPPISLTPIEARLLEYLMRNADAAVSHTALLEHISADSAESGGSRADIYIRRLRIKIEENPDRPEWIVTAPGVGYMFRSRPGRR
jgi:DNA-binding response OmpR family regulator